MLESARPFHSSLDRGAMVTSDMLTRAVGFNQENAWALLLALARRAGSGTPVVHDTALRLREDGSLAEDTDSSWFVARPSSKSGWSSIAGVTAEDDVARLLDIYMPLCVGGGSDAVTIAHLAQTLDGRVAIASGHSQFITGEEDLVHSHRLRALCDVVIVGRRTIEEDDPLLTTRRCTGPSPLRAVIDPDRRLRDSYRIFQPGAAPSLLFCKSNTTDGSVSHGAAEVVALAPQDGALRVSSIVDELRRRGHRRIYVEGGGVTVSRFLEQGALTRLHVTVAPTIFGSGRPSFILPEIASLSKARKLTSRTFALGSDVLFDCEIAR